MENVIVLIKSNHKNKKEHIDHSPIKMKNDSP